MNTQSHQKGDYQRAATAFVVGVVFAFGLGISGMVQPQKVIAFLDVSNWDASLLFVMIGAITVHSIAYFLVKNRTSPLLDTKWHLPTAKEITHPLIMGSALFGIGWGLAGFCPAPALTSLVSGEKQSFIFVFCLLLGMSAQNYVANKKTSS